MTTNNKKLQKKIPTSKVSRGVVVGKAMLKIGLQSSKGAVKRAFMSKENKEASKSQTNTKIAKTIIDSLGQLKGVSVKIAQHIALGMPFLPQEYLDEISKSFNAITPINKALIRKIIKQELGDYPQNIFESFDNEAFAAASLGQVHLATIDGKKYAVKVQYPGIAASIESDLSVLKFILMRFVKGDSVDHLMDEIGARLREEVDYEQEAKNTELFFNNFKHNSIVVPEIKSELSSKRVLTSSFLEGKRFEEFLASNPTQELKNHYAQLIFDSYFISFYQMKIIHADPNPGNFIFMEDGKLGLIDFGCVKRLDDDFLSSFSKLHYSLINNPDDTEITKQYAAIGMIDHDTPEKMLEFYQEVIKPLDRFYIEVFEGEKYDFKVNSDFSKRGFDIVSEVHKKQRHSAHNISEDYIFTDRALMGYYAMFEKMGATINTKFAKSLIQGGLK